MATRLPPVLEHIGRQLAVGLGRVAARAVTSGARSVTRDVEAVGKHIQRKARVTMARLDSLMEGPEEPLEDEEDDEEE